MALIFGGMALPMAWAGEVPPAANRWIPENALIVLEVTHPEAVLGFAAGEKATALITGLPQFKAIQQHPKYLEMVTGIRFLEASLETDWRTALGKLTGGGVTLAVCPENMVVLVADAKDGDMLRKVHQMFLGFAQNDPAKSSLVASTEYGDVTAWTFNGKAAHAIIGDRFVWSNRPEGLKTVLELRKEGKSLASNRNYVAAQETIDSAAVANVFADVCVLAQIPQLSVVLDQQNKNPLLGLLLAGLFDTIRNSNWLAMGLKIEDDTLAVKASVDGILAEDSKTAEFALPASGDGALRNLPVTHRIVGATFYRDLHHFYAAKDDLFPERTSGLIFFENMMGIFFTGRDLTNEVLAEAEPYIRLVVAEQQFDPAVGTPQLKLPAFALVLRLRNPEAFGPVMEEAWQKAVGLINFTRGQQALPGLIIDKQTQGDTRFTVACFSTVDVEDKTALPARYNLRPTLAMPGPYLVLSSTDGLARDLIDALSNETESSKKPLTGTHSLVELDARSLASVLEANRDALVHNDMVKKGHSQEEAEAAIDMLMTAVKLVKRAELGIGVGKELTQAELRVQMSF